jgi:hypothetical protein
LVLDELEPLTEFSIGFLKSGLGLDIQVTGEVYDDKQQVADLFGDFGDERFHGALKGLLQLDPGNDFQAGRLTVVAKRDRFQVLGE